MRLLFFDTKARNPNRYISRSIFLAIRRDRRVKEAVRASYADAVDLAQKGRFDALVTFDGEEAANAIVDCLCALIPKRATWFTEDPYEYYRNIEVATSAFSYAFISPRPQPQAAACFENFAMRFNIMGRLKRLVVLVFNFASVAVRR